MVNFEVLKNILETKTAVFFLEKEILYRCQDVGLGIEIKELKDQVVIDFDAENHIRVIFDSLSYKDACRVVSDMSDRLKARELYGATSAVEPHGDIWGDEDIPPSARNAIDKLDPKFEQALRESTPPFPGFVSAYERPYQGGRLILGDEDKPPVSPESYTSSIPSRQDQLIVLERQLEATQEQLGRAYEKISKLERAMSNRNSSIEAQLQDSLATTDRLRAVVDDEKTLNADLSKKLEYSQSKIIELDARLKNKNEELAAISNKLTLSEVMVENKDEQIAAIKDRADTTGHEIANVADELKRKIGRVEYYVEQATTEINNDKDLKVLSALLEISKITHETKEYINVTMLGIKVDDAKV